MSLFLVLLVFSSTAHGGALITAIWDYLHRIESQEIEDELASNISTVSLETVTRCSRLQPFWAMYVGGRCYTYVEKQLTWSEARETCRKIGGVLWKAIGEDYFVLLASHFIREYEASRILPMRIWADAGPGNLDTWNDGTKLDIEIPRDLIYTIWNWFAPRQQCLMISPSMFYDRMVGWKVDCTVPHRSLCQHEPETPPDHVVTSRPSTENKDQPVKKHTSIVVIKVKENCRVKSAPDWSVRAQTSTGCARKCRSHKGECLFFNYNSHTRQCRGFHSISLDGVGDHGWTLWKVLWKSF